MTELRDIDTWIAPDQVFDQGRLQEGHVVGLAAGRVQAVLPQAQLPDSARIARVGGTLTSGFVDLQVNGGGGVLLNATPTAKGMRQIAEAHRAFGTIAILPTVITDTAEVIAQAAGAAIEAQGQHGVLGLHIEGPHISLDRRGTHKAAHIRPFEPATLDQIARLRAAQVPTMITLAPEVVPTEIISEIVRLGAVVSIGHSRASAEEVREALAAGAQCFTHLYNAMPQMAGRKPGVVGAAINSEAYVGIICDGIHVADEMVGLAMRARPRPDRMFLVSDAMPTVGGPSAFDLYGTPVHLVENRLVNSEGSLAGAHTTQAAGVRRLVEHVGVPLQEALRMAITIPGQVLGIEMDGLVGRLAQDVLCLGADLTVAGSLAQMPEPQRA